MIRIKKAVYDQVIAHSRKDAPIEACGYLASVDGVIVEAYPMTNIDQSPEHFTLDPKEQFNILKQSRTKGQKLSVVYHSHPASPARPSQEDIRIAYDSEISYVIVSLAGDQPDFKSFRIRNGEVEKEEVEMSDA